MKRRKFLKLLGLGGVAAVPAVKAVADSVEEPTGESAEWLRQHEVQEIVDAEPTWSHAMVSDGFRVHNSWGQPSNWGSTYHKSTIKSIEFSSLGTMDILTIRPGYGSFTYTESRAITYELDRGMLDTVRVADEQPVEFELDFTVVTMQGEKTIREMVFEMPNIDPCEPNCFALKIEDSQRTLFFRKCYVETFEQDLPCAQYRMTGRCIGAEHVV